jgi:hypothetical protein
MDILKKTIKKVLNEVAGISFEVREWAKIIESYVDAEIEKLQSTEKEKSKEKETEIDLSQYGTPSEYGETEGYTHFEGDNDLLTDTAYIYGDELYINPDVQEDFPGIDKEVSGKLFRVYLVGDGSVEVAPATGNYITSYDFLEGVKEMVEDHMATGQAFYTDSYEYVWATSEGYEEDFEDYPTQGWSSLGGWPSAYSSYTPPKYPEKVIINGKQFPEAYDKFSVDKWIITQSGRIEYDHWRSGYDEDGEYVVYLNMPMSSIGGSMLVHEIKHAYDDWNRMRHGGKPIRDSWEIQNIYTKDFEKLVLGGSYKLSQMLHPLIRYYYLGSKLEAPAYLENEYDHASFTNYREVGKKLMNFRAKNFMNKKGEAAKGLQDSWDYLISNYDIPYFRKFTDVRDFLRATEKYFNKRGKDIVRRVDKMMYVHNKQKHRQSTQKK